MAATAKTTHIGISHLYGEDGDGEDREDRDEIYTFIKYVCGCASMSDNPIHDGIKCCSTHWSMQDEYHEPVMFLKIVPGCIKFTFGEKLFDMVNQPLCVRQDLSHPQKLDPTESIKMSCTLGCYDFSVHDVECDEGLGIYSPANTPEMLDRAIQHAGKHADIRAIMMANKAAREGFSVLLRSTHQRLGENSPVGIVDVNILAQIFSLTQL